VYNALISVRRATRSRPRSKRPRPTTATRNHNRLIVSRAVDYTHQPERQGGERFLAFRVSMPRVTRSPGTFPYPPRRCRTRIFVCIRHVRIKQIVILPSRAAARRTHRFCDLRGALCTSVSKTTVGTSHADGAVSTVFVRTDYFRRYRSRMQRVQVYCVIR